MENSFANIRREMLEEFKAPEKNHAICPCCSHFISQTVAGGLSQIGFMITEQNVPHDSEHMEVQPNDHGNSQKVVVPEVAHTSFNAL